MPRFYEITPVRKCFKQIKKTAPAFCSCREEPGDSLVGNRLTCSCGEERKVYEWTWDAETTSSATRLILDNREIHFHPGFSNGTAIIRGNKPFVSGFDYYWEIKVLTPLYGTDVMIGVGTTKVDLQSSADRFCSLLGSNEESWGYSYLGVIQHKGRKVLYGQPFGHGSIIGLHLDMWKGTLEFYLNREPLGVAFASLHDRILYPMVCSTAAKSAMRITYCTSSPSNLQLMCLQSLSYDLGMTKQLRTVPFLRSQIDREYWWLFPPNKSEGSSQNGETDSSDTEDEDIDNDDYGLDSLASFCASLSGVSAGSEQADPVHQRLCMKRKRKSDIYSLSVAHNADYIVD
ncbi:SPRY domain-containing SOCS box protein 3 [Periplaneta americana]|uniref:SPRY domain-containing SOCS box protein 3 n=1 Tax=Periplaneta americana TaxID=6978 RepID=UPI0037E7A2D2